MITQKPTTKRTMRPLTVKFCGLTRPDDLRTAIQLGVSAIGLVFYPKSPRFVDIITAQRLVAQTPAFTTVVALVVNMKQDELAYLARQVAFDIVQFHGDETPAECQSLAKSINKRWIKAIRVKADDTSDDIYNKINELQLYGASGVILDTFSDSAYGGTGHRFDWDKIPKSSPLPIYLAGGLTPENIGQIANNHALMTKIAGVDVSGGIEKEKGVKCKEKMVKFIETMDKNNG